MTNCNACDWLQCHVLLCRKDFEKTECIFFDIIKDDRQTQMFRELYHIHDKETGEEVAVLAASPRSEMCMKPNAGLIKITNKYLYQVNLFAFTVMALKDLQLTFLNITRLDIAFDFERFDTMEVPEFIENFRADTYLKTIQCKVNDYGKTRSVNRGKLTGGTETLKFGKETSEISYKLYNKSLEQAEKTNKPWIAEHWKSNGYEGKKTVWRLEFSINRLRKEIVTTDGNTVHMKDLEILKYLKEVWAHLFIEHFNFCYLEYTKKGFVKKQSRSTAVKLFESLESTGVSIPISKKKDSSRSAKIFAKNLKKLNDELRGQDFDLAIAGNEFFTYLVKSRNIEAWVKDKLGEVTYSERVTELITDSQLVRLGIEIASLPKEKKFLPANEQAAMLQNQKLPQKVPDNYVAFYNSGGEVCAYGPAPF